MAGLPVVQAQGPSLLVTDAKGSWASIRTNIVKAAEKMPAEDYSYRPTADVRSFGEVIGHVTDANYLFCSAIHAEKRDPPNAEKTLKTKAELVAALKASTDYCDAAVERLVQGQAPEQVKFFGRDRAGLSVIHMNIAHSNEHYGNLVTYMRLKGIVPPSSEPRPKAAALRLYFDRAHGFPLPSA